VRPSASFHHKCLCCRTFFRPSKGHPQQRFCTLPECRKASKQSSQRQWLERSPDYFRGPEHVERVRNWRAAHPGYSRGKKRKPKARKCQGALQDLVSTQVPEQEAVAPTHERQSSSFPLKEGAPISADSCSNRTLQDLVRVQVPLLVGFIVSTTGVALQETFISQSRRLVEIGQRVLDQAGTGSGRTRAQETVHSP